MKKEVRLAVPMIADMELTIAKTAAAIAEFVNMEQDQIDELSVAIIEAFVNSLEHSKSRDEWFHVTFEMWPDELRVIMQDFGKGFEPETVKERSGQKGKAEGLRKRGWGLRLMELFADDVEINSGSDGTTIKVVKKVKAGRRE